jgi:hypothetical protein
MYPESHARAGSGAICGRRHVVLKLMPQTGHHTRLRAFLRDPDAVDALQLRADQVPVVLRPAV